MAGYVAYALGRAIVAKHRKQQKATGRPYSSALAITEPACLSA
jgi:hypothetical protein